VPHSASGYGEIQVNRVYLVEMEKATETTAGKLTLNGQESAPPTSVAMVTWLHGQIAGMQEGRVIPVLFRDKDERNGFYSVETASSDLTNYQDEVALADWQIDLQRLGAENEIDIQSRLTGAIRQNDFGVTGVRWHAPAIGHYAYLTGTTVPSNHNRVTEDGTIRVYTGIPNNTSPRWGCAPEDYLKGSARVTSTVEVGTENIVEGINRHIGPSDWVLSNGLINVTPTASAGVLAIGLYSSGSYRTVNWEIRSGGDNLLAWESATLIRNDPEMCILRLLANRSASTGGRESLDLTLRRGAQFVEGFLQVSDSQNLGIQGQNSAASASAANGTVAATANDANGIRRACGSARSWNTTNASNCGLTKNSTTKLDFWIGATIGAGTAGATQVADLQNQYIAAMPEATYGVRR
jgi:hypothetical protein